MSSLIPCTRCGDYVDASSTLLSDAGEPICTTCNDKADVDVAEQRAAGAIFAASGGSNGIGVASIFVNPCLVLSVLGVLSAVSTFVLVYRHPEYRARLGWKLPATIVVAALGLAVSLGSPIVRILLELMIRR